MDVKMHLGIQICVSISPNFYGIAFISISFDVFCYLVSFKI